MTDFSIASDTEQGPRDRFFYSRVIPNRTLVTDFSIASDTEQDPRDRFFYSE